MAPPLELPQNAPVSAAPIGLGLHGRCCYARDQILGVPAGVLMTEGIIDSVVEHAAEHRYISHRAPRRPGASRYRSVLARLKKMTATLPLVAVWQKFALSCMSTNRHAVQRMPGHAQQKRG